MILRRLDTDIVDIVHSRAGRDAFYASEVAIVSAIDDVCGDSFSAARFAVEDILHV